MKKLYVIALIIFLTGCNFPPFEKISNKEACINAAEKKAANQIATQLGLSLIGTGAQAMNEIKMLGLYFVCYHQVTVDEARVLIASAMNIYLSIINEDPEIRPYLSKYPFEPKNMEISISIFQPDGSEPFAGEITFAQAERGKVSYQISESGDSRTKTICTESFEESVKKLKQQQEKKIADTSGIGT